MEPDSCVELSAAGWTQAGGLAGALSRLQGFALDRYKALFLDAALFVTAQEFGLTLASAKLTNMDLLLQIGGEAMVLLYRMEQQASSPPVHGSGAAQAGGRIDACDFMEPMYYPTV